MLTYISNQHILWALKCRTSTIENNVKDKDEKQETKKKKKNLKVEIQAPVEQIFSLLQRRSLISRKCIKFKRKMETKTD